MYETDSPGAATGPKQGAPDPALDAPLTYDVLEADGRAVVSLRGELDLASSPELLRQLHVLIRRPTTAITLDLDGLSFIDSSGLGVLCRVHQETAEANVAFTLDRVPDHARRVLEITGLTELFEVR